MCVAYFCMHGCPCPSLRRVDSTMHFASVCHRGVETGGDITGEPTDSPLSQRPSRSCKLQSQLWRRRQKKKLTNAERAKMFQQTPESRPDRIGRRRARFSDKFMPSWHRTRRDGEPRAQRTAPGGRAMSRAVGANGEGQFCRLRCATPTHATINFCTIASYLHNDNDASRTMGVVAGDGKK